MKGFPGAQFRSPAAKMADVAVLEKENLTPSGRSTTAAKRPAEWKAEKADPAKKKGGLRPSTRVINIPHVAKDASQPPKPAVMGPPPPRVPQRADDGATAGPSKAPVQVKALYTLTLISA